jgi:hypothetical protein
VQGALPPASPCAGWLLTPPRHQTSRSLPCSHNGIEQLEGLGQLVNLKILDIANNRIKRLEGLEALQVRCWDGR